MDIIKHNDHQMITNEFYLYITSLNSIRGIDIPNLEYIFLISDINMLKQLNHNYIHLAGRVARNMMSQTGYSTMIIEQNNINQYYFNKLIQRYKHQQFIPIEL